MIRMTQVESTVRAPKKKYQRLQTLNPALLLLGGSWVVISGVISPLILVITIVTLLITPLIPTYEPPSRLSKPWSLFRRSLS